MSARPVEAFRGAWSALDEPLSDAGVALDVLSTFDPKYGPTVVRVRATGGTTAARRSVAGDWLCDRSAPNGRTSRFERDSDWRVALLGTSFHPGAVSQGWPALDVYEGDSMPYLLMEAACAARVERTLLVRAAWACAVSAVGHLGVNANADGTRRLLALVDAWSRGNATRDEVREWIDRAYANLPDDLTTYACRSAVDVALAIPRSGDEADGRHLGQAVSGAEIALYHAPGRRSWSVARAECSSAIRSQLPAIDFLRACRTQASYFFAAGG